MEFVVRPRPPYDFTRVIQRCMREPFYHVNEEGEELSFAVRIKRRPGEEDWQPVVCILANEGTVDTPRIRVTVKGSPLTEADQKWLQRHLNQRFQWQTDVLERFYDAVQSYEPLRRLTCQLRGFPLVQDEGIYEGLVQTIIQQQLNFSFSRQLAKNLARFYGQSIACDGREYLLLPTPSELARLSVDELRQLKFSARKAEYIINVGRKVASGELKLEELAQLDNEGFIERITREKGIGLWTAECVLLFCLARPNLFPAADIGLRNALQKLEQLEKRPTPEECREWVKPYADWASYITIYLWGSLG
ncbi:putative DNA-3-methyladenine glycosylase YfjP [Caldalkalibacillus thermarum]|uniref:DNA-3-methyladenine glycosylase family protein n=1 Tax=Caldalkalibacillus thermarum TaxID=296745 RepID=UPI00166E8DB6|nr:DNA-3-methyladenine glycosylase 2 family protein [Caldalkalibacillus thermarum]GGK27986.1 putative DNA-3-methyladenine glycosylase YfjP [Caldalkalibacillus thermarum]